MSSETPAPTPTLHKFIVFAPDKKGAVQHRLDVRPAHVAKLKETIGSGFIKVGGILLTPESVGSEEKTMIGSTFICEAESLERVREVVEGDVYWKEEVWDRERVVILPLLAVVGV
ncbi:hypothetical protein PLICRDRAFT_44810 [Plicaturopsis crispa FD-325 SS-3]|nr:hypothetical protein PLICRDRAFT_44810 [Plicaturopsis crispa FD-325 SS-3]